jgi:hypothetical protein
MCISDDAIQKVSVVVASGKSSGRFSGPSGGISYSDGKLGSVGGWTTLGGSTSTELAKTLTPPPHPKKGEFTYPAKIFSALLSIFTIGISCMGGWALIGVVVGVLIIIGMVSYFGVEQIETNNLTGGAIEAFGAVALGLCGGIFGLVAGIFGYIKQRSYSKNLIYEKERAYALEKIAWEKAMNRWDRLYFCHRDGIIFDPISKEASQPESLNKLIYSPTS